MQNLSPAIAEYIILTLALIAVTLLAAMGKMQIDNAVEIILTVIGYATGSAKGAIALAAIQNTNNGPTPPQTPVTSGN